VIFIGGNYCPDWISTYPFNSLPAWPEAASIPGHPATKGDVVIGHDVWIGDGAVILSGVTIGNGAVIGARAVVTRSVPPYAIIAGNPAPKGEEPLPPAVAAALNQIAWWDKPDHEVKALVPLLMSGDLRGFFRAFRSCHGPIPGRAGTCEEMADEEWLMGSGRPAAGSS
jgi:hypothetical protein